MLFLRDIRLNCFSVPPSLANRIALSLAMRASSSKLYQGSLFFYPCHFGCPIDQAVFDIECRPHGVATSLNYMHKYGNFMHICQGMSRDCPYLLLKSAQRIYDFNLRELQKVGIGCVDLSDAVFPHQNDRPDIKK